MATDAYTELKDLPELTGSINTYISSANKLRRPPSLSESFAWTPENILRANNSNTSLDMLISDPVVEDPPITHVAADPIVLRHDPELHTFESLFINVLLRFLFHITLISIFESVFFFLYVSQLEDNGINITVGTFINGAVNGCRNFTSAESTVATDFLSLFINSSQVISVGNAVYSQRMTQNAALFGKAWIYVGSLGGLFILIMTYSMIRRHKINWRYLFLENIGLVLMLAAYEYMFFSTIIFPYAPVSADEIARNAVLLLQSQCHILT